MEAFYEQNPEDFKTKYKRNVNALLKYQYIYHGEFPDFSELNYCFIPCSDTKFIVFDNRSRGFIMDFDLKYSNYNFDIYNANDVLMYKNDFSEFNIAAGLEKTKDTKPFLSAKTPLYLYYDRFDKFVQFLQVCDFTEVLKTERLVFLFGREEMDRWFADPQSVLPMQLLNAQSQDDGLLIYLREAYKRKDALIASLMEKVNFYYNNLSKEDILVNIKNGKPRILFITSRFSTAIQYYIRDCSSACDELDIPNRVIIEKSDIHRFSRYECLSVMEEFKPDIIFVICHFRWEFPWIPNNVVFATWLQDQLPEIMSKESPAKMGDLDFILNVHLTSRDIFSIGYPEEKMIEAPAFANHKIYKIHALAEKEKSEYAADICVFSNTGNPRKGLDCLLNNLKGSPCFNQLENAFKCAFDEAYRMTYDEKPLHDVNQMKELILKWCNVFVLSTDDKTIDAITNIFRNEIVWRIYRSVIMEWLHEKGYDMKLWGMEWLEHPVLKKYAMGVAQNGETLSRIINASKIVIGINPASTTHPRVFETILSNSFYLAVNVPEPYDWANLRLLMEEGREVVFFYNKEDLYNKIDYYLQNEEKRKEIVKNGREKIMASLTYEALMKKITGEIAQRMEGWINRGK